MWLCKVWRGLYIVENTTAYCFMKAKDQPVRFMVKGTWGTHQKFAYDEQDMGKRVVFGL